MNGNHEQLRILVVDDEWLEREAIPIMLKHYEDMYKVVGEAKNGKEAISTAAELKPDIILLDIKMPGIDGLTAASHIKKESPSSVIIFLTAYDQFEYAKEALKVGAMDYLIKPLGSKDLLEALNKAQVLIAQEKLRETEQLKLERQLKEALPWLRLNLGLSLAFGTWEERSRIERQADILQLEVLPQAAFGVYIEHNNLNDPLHTVSDLARYNLQQLIEDLLKKYSYGLCLPIGDKLLLGLLGTTTVDIEKDLYSIANEIIHNASEKLSLGVTVGLGNTCKDISEIPRSVWEAQLAADLGMFYLGSEHVVHIGELGERLNSIEMAQSTGDNNLVEALKQGNIGQVKVLFKHFLGQLSCDSNVDLYLVKARLINILIIFARSMGINLQGDQFGESSVYYDFARKIELCQSIDDLENWILELGETGLRIVNSTETKSVSSPIQKVLEYIEENYNSELTLSNLSKVIYLSPDYFSRIFKDQVGSTFSEYILKIRIEKAKELLNNLDIPVSEIGRKVGYSDPNYFSRVFTRAVGMPPSRFRQVICSHPKN
ncbi:response regulator [Desulfitibacter alkalitolerans]|uniref:response regulator n=1 Tax=Desulfitibacter alkalitolerans TaxID=264641 RepID=UPI0004830B83|nr:response regulator [Desulfitibacter alkalitolerans]